MKEIPILFSTDMVRAINQYKKKRTRRTKGLEKINLTPEFFRYDGSLDEDINGELTKFKKHWFEELENGEPNENYLDVKCKYGEPGDILWVKETYYAYGHWTTITENGKSKKKFWDLTSDNNYSHQYHADWQPKELAKFGQLGWHKRPALFMPKVIAKKFLKITSITCERLQDITQEGAIEEGIFDYNDGTYKNYFTKKGLREKDCVECLLPKGSFQSLWCSINGLESWDANPWVWVIEFERVAKP